MPPGWSRTSRTRSTNWNRREPGWRTGRVVGWQGSATERDITRARELLPWLTETEAWLRTRLQRMNRRTDEFRVRNEVLKATYVTARTELQLAEEIPVATDPGAGTEAAARLRDVTAEIRQQLGRQPLPD